MVNLQLYTAPRLMLLSRREILRLGTNVKKIEVKPENPTAMLNKIFYDLLKEVWGAVY